MPLTGIRIWCDDPATASRLPRGNHTMRSIDLAATAAALIAAVGLLPAAAASVPAVPPASATRSAVQAAAVDDGARDKLIPNGHSPRGVFLYGWSGEYVISPSGATLYRNQSLPHIASAYRLCGDMLVTGAGLQQERPFRVSWKNLATGRTGTSLTDYGTNLIGPAPGGILYAEQTPTALDTSSDIVLRAPDGSRRRLATVPGFIPGGPAACDTSGIAVISKVFSTTTTDVKEVLSFVRFSGGAVTLATRPESSDWPLRIVEVNGTTVLWSIGQAGRTSTTLYRSPVGGTRTTVVTVPKSDAVVGAGASSTETLYTVDHEGVWTTTSLRQDGTRVVVAAEPESQTTWWRVGSEWRGAGQDGVWSLAGTAAARLWQPPHVIANVFRQADTNRYGTATGIQEPLPDPDTVYIASGADYPDALSGGPAAVKVGGSLVLTPTTSLPSAVRSYLTGASPTEVVVLGGTSVVSTAVETELRGYAPSVRRVSGRDRYATAAAVSKDRFPDRVGGTVVVTSGVSFADALSAGPAAASWGGPLLLTAPTALPAVTAAELDPLKPDRVVLVGGTGAVSAAVAMALAAHAGTVERVSGADRYATAAKVSAKAFPTGALVAYVVTGEDFPDGIAAGAVVARRGGPLLLTPRSRLPAVTKAELTRLRPDTAVVIGGEGVVSSTAYAGVAGVWWP
jgi:putative cell wall-binding protein